MAALQCIHRHDQHGQRSREEGIELRRLKRADQARQVREVEVRIRPRAWVAPRAGMAWITGVARRTVSRRPCRRPRPGRCGARPADKDLRHPLDLRRGVGWKRAYIKDYVVGCSLSTQISFALQGRHSSGLFQHVAGQQCSATSRRARLCPSKGGPRCICHARVAMARP